MLHIEMLFRRRNPLDLAAVPDELLRAEVLRREQVVLGEVAGEALARWMVGPVARVAELEAELRKCRDHLFRQFKGHSLARAEVERLAAIHHALDLGFSASEARAWCNAGYGRVTGSANNE